jgi:hypothetical protein
VTDVIVLAEFAQARIFDHAAAQPADWRLAHWGAPGLEVEGFANPVILKPGHFTFRKPHLPRAAALLMRCRRLPRERFRCVPGMFSSLEVKVLCAT